MSLNVSREGGQRFARGVELCRYFGITKMCLWKWRHDPDLHFPAPVVIRGTPFFDMDEIDRWTKERVVHRANKKTDALA
jgi:predicted DNA-binding transcriptional regulator AlpA